MMHSCSRLAARSVRFRCPRARQYPLVRPCWYKPQSRPYYSSPVPDAGNQDQNADVRHSAFAPLDTFPHRHVGPSPTEADEMLNILDPPAHSLDDFVKQVLPPGILSSRNLHIDGPNGATNKNHTGEEGFSESQLLARLRTIVCKNKVMRSYIGCGYAGTRVPEVIKRNVLEGPGWYTSYTPYQPEISQGRLESLLNFQTMVSDLTGLPIANASVLDEPTAAAEAMTLSLQSLPISRQRRPNKVYCVSHLCHPQTIAVLHARAEGFGIKIHVGDILANNMKMIKSASDDLIGALVQYPDTEGGADNFQ